MTAPEQQFAHTHRRATRGASGKVTTFRWRVIVRGPNHPRFPRTERLLASRISAPPPPSVTAIRVLPFVPRADTHRAHLPPLTWEPVSGIEPLTCRLQEVGPQAPCALAAPMAHVIALTALTALGLSGTSFHETFHADGRHWSTTATERSDRNPPHSGREGSRHSKSHASGCSRTGSRNRTGPGRRVSEDDDERGVRAWGQRREAASDLPGHAGVSPGGHDRLSAHNCA